MEHLFSSNLSTDLGSDAQQSQIIGEDADDDHTQIVGGGGYSQIIGGDISPPGFRHHCTQSRLFLNFLVRFQQNLCV